MRGRLQRLTGPSALMVRWPSWLWHLSYTQKVLGSSPGRIIFASLPMCVHAAISFERRTPSQHSRVGLRALQLRAKLRLKNHVSDMWQGGHVASL